MPNNPLWEGLSARFRKGLTLDTTGVALFIVSTIGISLSGVMLPGPLTAVTIAKGFHNKNAGALIAVGHGIVEIPLMAAIYLGFTYYLTFPEVGRVLGIAGGLMLIFMGATLLRSMSRSVEYRLDLPYNSLTTGILMTATNPYFYLWWVTIGSALLARSTVYGLPGLLAFGIIHWTCDLGWEQSMSFSVFKTRHLWTAKAQKAVFGICALVLLGFGIWFTASGIRGA
jgi:threonine/homoserine/homoserine lactone efflux protein